MKRLILVRAGSTAWAHENRIQGTVPLPLSGEGERELVETAEALSREGPEVLYSSGNESSGATAERLSELCHVKNRKIPLLRELDCGLWQGLRVDEVKQRYGRAYRQWRSDPSSIVPPQGESIQDALSRVREGLETVDKKSGNKTVVIVAAPIVSALVECALTGRGLGELWDIADEGGEPKVFDFQEDSGSESTWRLWGERVGVRTLTSRVGPGGTNSGDRVEVHT